jgi:hypothetical protein
MKDPINCWEFRKCGREPGGNKTDVWGECPACTDTTSDGVNGGLNAGRCCWLVSGTFCDGEVQGTLARKLGTCFSCEFYQLVLVEEVARA